MNNYKVGDVLSEVSHYKITDIKSDKIIVYHYETKSEIPIGVAYIDNCTLKADHYGTTILVTKEDSSSGQGIRSIFENITNEDVFTVCFTKQNKVKSKSQINKEFEDKINEFVELIDKTKNQKKNISKVSKAFVQNLIENPITKEVKGEDRILRGYKVQYQSRDGKYLCVDMDIDDTNNNTRLVNINTIKYLIYKGIMYVVK